ncbi:MAG TPA: HAD-IA family hydrolase [Candidatus Saccharimonadales bacterium]|nr:HAD-IA family hydrolase [Candidatus Saccharimonadales bacterium]
MINTLFFDCFGVLYVDVSHAYFSRFPEHHEALYDLNKQADHGFIDRTTYTQAVAKITGVSEEETARAFSREHVINQPLIDFIRGTLKSRYKIGLISNIGRGWIQDFFDEHQLHDLFEVVVMSSEEGITKPNPLIFERAADRMSVSPDECLFIDDIQANCDGAKQAGMQALLFTTNDQLREALKNTMLVKEEEK